MGSSTKEQDTLSAALAGAGAVPPATVKPQPAAVEIPVTVNGARTVEGTDKREPFSEDTQTVLVFAKGAVIRLSSSVASGQLLFLTNEKTKKEVVCQVVKSKNYSSANGYVELEFTEAAPGFWGMRFPTAGLAPGAQPATKPAAVVSAIPLKSLEEKLAEERSKSQAQPAMVSQEPIKIRTIEAPETAKQQETHPLAEAKEVHAAPVAAAVNSLQARLIETTTKTQAVPTTELPKRSEIKFASGPELAKEPAESAATKSNQFNVARIVQAPPEASALKIPTLSEFLTHGAKRPEPRGPEKGKTESPEQSSNESSKESSRRSEEEAAFPQSQLSSLLFKRGPVGPVTEKKTNVEPISNSGRLTQILVAEKKAAESNLNVPPPVNVNPAPGTCTFDFGADEVKIPAWLEPLARNSAISTTTVETKAPERRANEIKSTEGESFETLATNSSAHGQPEQELSEPEEPAEYSEKDEAALTLASGGPTPNFGSSLAIDTRTQHVESAVSGSRQGLVFGLAAAGLLMVAGGGWYWYSNQQQKVSTSGSPSTLESFSAAPASSTASRAPQPADPASSNAVNASALTAPGDSNGMASPANGDVRPVSDAGNSAPGSMTAVAPTVELATKRSLGRVHLAKPVAKRRTPADSTTVPELTLNDSDVTERDPGSLGLLANKSKQPAAPLPVGGDVKQARLVSSVPPIYPQLARNQRMSGDVMLDALIDATGRVTTTKVISGPALLHQSATDAVRQWKYQPATLNGQPLAMHLMVTVQFRLQ